MLAFNQLTPFNSTIILFNNNELRTMQDPFVSDDGEQYKAHAVDAQGNEYTVLWDVIDPHTTDESEACNWGEPARVTLM